MKPTSILGRYISKQLVLNFLAVLMMIIGIILMFEVIELLRRTSGRPDVNGWFLLQMAVTKLPQTLDIVFPFVMLIASIMSFWKISKNNEYVIIRAAGVSIWGSLLSVLITA